MDRGSMDAALFAEINEIFHKYHIYAGIVCYTTVDDEGNIESTTATRLPATMQVEDCKRHTSVMFQNVSKTLVQTHMKLMATDAGGTAADAEKVSVEEAREVLKLLAIAREHGEVNA